MFIKHPYNVPDSMRWLERVVPFLYFAEIVLTLLTICMAGSAISIQTAHEGGSQAGPNYTIFACVITLLISISLLLFPWIRRERQLCQKVGAFFERSRNCFILSTFSTLAGFSGAIAITTYANATDTCNLKNRDGYEDDWSKQCTAVKVAAAFAWFAFFCWLVTAAFTGFIFWNEKKSLDHEKAANDFDKEPRSDLEAQSPHHSYTVPDESNHPRSPSLHYGDTYAERMSPPAASHLTAGYIPHAPTPPMASISVHNSPQPYGYYSPPPPNPPPNPPTHYDGHYDYPRYQ